MFSTVCKYLCFKNILDLTVQCFCLGNKNIVNSQIEFVFRMNMLFFFFVCFFGGPQPEISTSSKTKTHYRHITKLTTTHPVHFNAIVLDKTGMIQFCEDCNFICDVFYRLIIIRLKSQLKENQIALRLNQEREIRLGSNFTM